ncbi:MAG TPA: hypothetical protein VH951_07365, partial [Dehalococcoidia bacterium]
GADHVYVSPAEPWTKKTLQRFAIATFLGVAAVLAAAACSSGSQTSAPAALEPSPTAAAAPAPAVPEKYRATYAELGADLDKFEQTLTPGAANPASIGVVSSSLIMANSNSGPSILRPQVLDAAKTYMDDMAKMGSKGLEVQISYPVASKDFPNQDAYIAFYKQVMDAARQRGFTVLIETSVVFANSPFTQVQFDGSKLTPQAYFQARTDEIVTIAKELRPDYLALGEEPVNERVFGGINYTPDQYIAFVNSAYAAVKAALGPDASKVNVGVGAGTWEFDLYRSFIEQTDLDFYDIHIYPLGGAQPGLQTARQMAKLAQAKGRPAIIGETWLYKLSQAEQGNVSGATASEAFRRDAFTFWEPLEARYMRDVLALVSELKLPFVSFWGARFFFGQVDWTPQLDALDFNAISSTVNPIITQGFNAGTHTALGDDFERLMGR